MNNGTLITKLVNTMARRKDKEKAIQLRKKGYSYSQINAVLKVSKSTLSTWLRDIPLSKQRLDTLQRSEKIIEKIRATKQKKRTQRLASVHETVAKDIHTITDREFFLAGFFLYWAEGGKTTKYAISLSNTNPHMIRAFIAWLRLLKVPQEKIVVYLHLYKDMNIQNELDYWHKETGVPANNFRKPYIKNSKLSDLTHTTRGHGTCNIIVNGRDIAEYVHQGLKKNRFTVLTCLPTWTRTRKPPRYKLGALPIEL